MTIELSNRKWFKQFDRVDLSFEDRERSELPFIIDESRLKTVI